ncbi:MAG: hypothetical protein KC420_09560, partial [Myxococcales bacterium]|nr:hypothetical protein [Myxococcales bacterium]
GEALAAERAVTADLRRRNAALELALAEKSAALGHVLQEAAQQAERLTTLDDEGAALRQLQSRHAELQRAYDRQAGEQAPLRGEVEDLRGQLKRALEINNQLYERLEAAGIVGLAGGLLSSLLQPKPKKE